MTQTAPTPVPAATTPKPAVVATKGGDEKPHIPEGINPDLLVSLKRTPCFGSCPAYSVEIFKDGRVKYNGVGYVKRLGNFTATASAAFIVDIQKRAESMNYMKLSDKYPLNHVEIADLPTTISYIRIGNEGKMIANNFDAPKELVEFERWLEKQVEGLKWEAVKE